MKYVEDKPMLKNFKVYALSMMAFSVMASWALAGPKCSSALSEAKKAHSEIIVLQPTQGQKVVPVSEIGKLRFLSYNMENFYNYVGKYEAVGPNQLRKVKQKVDVYGRKQNSRKKDPRKTQQIAQIIDWHIRADIAQLQEVDGEESLDRFSRFELADQYEGIHVFGNDPRGIQLGSLINTKYPFEIELRSYKNITWKDPADENRVQPVFSRDAQVSVYKVQGGQSPFLVAMNIHSKSKRDRKGDPESYQKRLAQHKALVQIYRQLQEEFGDAVPVVISGDTNTDVVSGSELVPIKEAGFKDVLELMSVSLKDRVTHTYHPRGGATVAKQMDAIFLSPSLQKYLVDAKVYRYVDASGNIMPIADSFEQRKKQPSDHLPIYADIDFTELIRASLKQ